MTKPIHQSLFFDSNDQTLNLALKISLNKTLKISSHIHKSHGSWKISLIANILIHQGHSHTCNLPPITLKPMEKLKIGAWNDIFMKEDQCSLPLDLKLLEAYANENLLEIKAYQNGISIQSEYLQVETLS